MSEHPDLLALLRGELRNPVVVEAGDHLDTCAACRSDLAELVTAHSLLSRSARTLGNPAPAPEPAPEHAPALPPVPRPSSRRRAAGVLVAAVAVAVAGTTVVLTRAPDDPGTPAHQLSAALDPVTGSSGGESAGGRVLMAAGTARTTDMTITTRDLPAAHRGHFYEAWLLDPATQKMLPLGQLGPSGRATFQLDDRLLGRYSAVDVSLEADDGNPQHSVTSVLRASYDAQPLHVS